MEILPQVAAYCVQQMLRAVNYMHINGIMHRSELSSVFLQGRCTTDGNGMYEMVTRDGLQNCIKLLRLEIDGTFRFREGLRSRQK